MFYVTTQNFIFFFFGGLCGADEMLGSTEVLPT